MQNHMESHSAAYLENFLEILEEGGFGWLIENVEDAKFIFSLSERDVAQIQNRLQLLSDELKIADDFNESHADAIKRVDQCVKVFESPEILPKEKVEGLFASLGQISFFESVKKFFQWMGGFFKELLEKTQHRCSQLFWKSKDEGTRHDEDAGSSPKVDFSMN